MNYELNWISEPPNPEDKAKVREELEQLLADGLASPEELITHLVFLGAGVYGPSVHVFGDPDTPGVFHCEYSAETEWRTVEFDEELEDPTDDGTRH